MVMRGSYKLDLKRDDARTLMLKMDARLTYAGRERNVAYQLEGKRELRQLESTLRLLNADLNRAQKKIQQRIDFFQTLQKQNKERRHMREIAWCDEEEKEWEREARAARRRKTLPKIEIRENHKAEVVGSIRRDQKREYANKMARESHLNRSLNALSKSYAKHRTLTERNEAKLVELQGGVEKIPIRPTGDEGEPKKSRTKTAPKQMSLPELLMGKIGTNTPLQSVPQSQKIIRLPSVTEHEGTPALYGGPAKKATGMLGSFYMNTSTAQHEHGTTYQRKVYLVDPTVGGETVHHRADSKLSKPQVSKVKPSTNTNKRPKPLSTLSSQPNLIPLRFYEPEKNPFDGGITMPALNRSKDLINADKDDEMYIWLGLESEEELDRLRRGDFMLQQFDGEESWSDASSNVVL